MGKMTNSSSEESTDDEITIQNLAQRKLSKQHGVSSAKTELIRYTKEECEFCEKICYNKYDTFVHNASHIIVPLTHNIPHCKLCNMLFESPAKLEAHNENKHLIVPNILKNIVKIEPVIKVDSSITNLKHEANKMEDETVMKTEQIECSDTFISSKEPVISQFINKLPVIRCDDTVTRLINGEDAESKIDTEAKNAFHVDVNQSLINLDSDKVKRIDEPNPKPSLDFITKLPSVQCDDVIKSLLMGDSKRDHGKIGNTEDNVINIKSKIVFEDEMGDSDEDIISFDKDQQVNDFNGPVSNDNEEYKNNEIVLGSKMNGVTNRDMKSQTVEGTFAPAVHYDELMQFGLFGCKFCKLTFSNKYQRIMHEVAHMEINPRPKTLYMRFRVCRYCDQYIAGNHWNLKRHHARYHADLEEKYQTTYKLCSKCHLRYYSYGRHFFKYHLLYKCLRCAKPFESESAMNCHSSSCHSMKYLINSEPRVGELRTTKVCNVCALFNLNNNRFKQQYKVVGSYSEKGKRVQCEACSKEFFEVNLLSYVYYHKNWQYHTKTRVPLTNETRLKNINQRLKKMKMLSRT